MAATKVMKIASLQDEIKKYPEMKMEYIETFREWVEKQPHFPRLDDDILLLQFLQRCRNSIEKAKLKLDNYLTFRTHFPEQCVSRKLDQPEIETMLTDWQHVLLPKRDHNGNIVILLKSLSTEARSCSPSSHLKIIMTIVECYFRQNGTIPGYVIVSDSTNINLAHVAGCTFTSSRQFLFFVQKCSPVSIKGFYSVNSNKFAETILTFLKSITPGNMVSKIQLYPQGANERFYEHIPKEIMPKEYGGEAGTMDELHKKTLEMIRRSDQILETSDRLFVDESKRVGPQKDADSMFGLQGSFKKLNVD